MGSRIGRLISFPGVFKKVPDWRDYPWGLRKGGEYFFKKKFWEFLLQGRKGFWGVRKNFLGFLGARIAFKRRGDFFWG